MNILFLLKLILNVAGSDIQTAEYLEKFKKSSGMFNDFLKNPGGILSNQILSKVLGHGKTQQQLAEFQNALHTITNLPVVKKTIMNHIMTNNFAKLQSIKKQYLTGQGLMQKGKEFVMNNLQDKDYEDMIGVYVNLSSSALAGGMWTPVIQQQSGTYGIATLTYRTNLSKSYDYFMVSRETWLDMVKATGMYGAGANSVFIREYANVGMTKKQSEAKTRQNVKNMNSKVSNPSKYKSVIAVVNKPQANSSYGRYKNYGKQK